MYFDGDDYILVPHNDTLDIRNKITIMCWYMSTRVADMGLISKACTKAWGHYDFFLAFTDAPPQTQRFCPKIGGTHYHTYGKSPVSGTGMHVGANVFDGSYIKIWVDGKFETVRAVPGTIDPTDRELNIGRHVRLDTIVMIANYYYGYLFQALIYKDYALSDAELKQNMSNPLNPVKTNLVLWMRAEPAYVKDIDGDGILEWLDLSGNGNNGKIYGARLVQFIKPASRVIQAQGVLPCAR
jgi:hypothetical protein